MPFFSKRNNKGPSSPQAQARPELTPAELEQRRMEDMDKAFGFFTTTPTKASTKERRSSSASFGSGVSSAESNEETISPKRDNNIPKPRPTKG